MKLLGAPAWGRALVSNPPWTLGAPAWGRALVSNPPLLLTLRAPIDLVDCGEESGHGSSSFGLRNHATTGTREIDGLSNLAWLKLNTKQ